jgi:outer membrane protein TolC
MENLTQAERSMIYTLRSYVRFQRDFDVSIASSYYGILQQRDLIENVRLDMEGKTTAADRAQMMAEAGRIPDYQVGQARQEELNAKDSYIIAVESYERQLDAFKIQLGLPVDAPLALDPAELSKLAEQEIPKPTHTSEEATRLALALRLDLATAADDVADSERKVKVAKDNLNPGVDLLLNAAIGTEAPSKALSFTKDNSSVGYGVSVDLPLNQVAQRNAYVASLISVDRSKRALDQTRDQIRLQINDDLRRLEQARQSYDIQKISLQLAERQVDNERMLLEAGRVAMRDLLDAQNALLGARNGLTRTLLEHRMALLQLWRDMEVLTFKNGQFTEEIPNDNQRNG